MSDRTSTRPEPRPARKPTLPEAVRVRRHRLRPSVEGLEGRTLLSYGGAADLSFGTGGFQPITTSNGVASALQANGKLVVAGASTGPINSNGISRDFTVSRYNADGTLDKSFASSGSFTNPALSFLQTSLDDPRIASGEAIAIQADGKIVVAGEVGNTAKVIRLDADGSLDTSFGSGGIVTLGTIGGGQGALAFAEAVALLPGGQIAVGGVFEASAPAVQRLNADGSVDTTFNNGGLALAPLPSGAISYPALGPLNGELGFSGQPVPVTMVAQPNGQILLASSALTTGLTAQHNNTEIVVTRFTTSGALDATYGTSGQAVVTPGSILTVATTDAVTTIALQPDGKLVVGGALTLGTEIGVMPLGPAPQLLALRLGANGQVDTSFGIGGAFISTGFASFNSTAGALAIQPDGKIVVADVTSCDFIRLTASGLPDAGFGVGGKSYVTTPYGVGQDGSSSLSILPDGKLIATLAFNAGEMVRLLGNGAPSDFDNDGASDPAVYNTATGQLTYFSTLKQTTVTIPFGSAGAGQSLPAPGAYDGGGLTEVAVYLPSQGAFANLTPTFGYGSTTLIGTPGVGNSLPAPGDYDLSGKTEYAVYEPQTGSFVYQPGAGGPQVTVGFGTPGAGQSIPAPADYFGTGQTDFAVYLPDQGAYAIRNPVTNQDEIIPFGTPGAGKVVPVPGDYDGSGHAELAVYLPQYAELIYRPANGGSDVVEDFGIAGAGLTLPAPGDYDGSGKTEAAAYYPTLGLFDFRPANGGPDVIFPLGTANQSIPFVAVSATDGAAGGSGGGNGFNRNAASVEIPLTSDLLDLIAGLHAGKKTGSA